MPPIIPLKSLYENLEKIGARKKNTFSIETIPEITSRKLSEKQKQQLHFVPKIEAVILKDSEDLWFRIRGRDWTRTFILLPNDLVLLIAEYAAGADKISIMPCGGLTEKGESLTDCAIREAKEESGIVLESVVPLSKEGMTPNCRRMTERGFMFLGIPKLDNRGQAMFVEPKHDECEDIYPFLMTLKDYWSFIGSDSYDNSIPARDCAYAALRQLGRLKFS